MLLNSVRDELLGGEKQSDQEPDAVFKRRHYRALREFEGKYVIAHFKATPAHIRAGWESGWFVGTGLLSIDMMFCYPLACL